MKYIIAAVVLCLASSGCSQDPESDKLVYPDYKIPAIPEARMASRPATAPSSSRPVETAEVQLLSRVEAPTSQPTTRPASQPASAPGSKDLSYRVTGQQEVVAASLAQVNDKFITLQQIIHPIRKQLQGAAAVSEAEEEFRNKAADMINRETRNQIEQMILVAEAEKRLTEDEKKVVQEQIDEHVRRIIAEVGSKALLNEKLTKEGTDVTAWIDEVKRAMMVDGFIHQQFKSKVNVDRPTMLKYYNSHPELYRQGEQVQMQVISAPFAGFMSTTQPDTIEYRRAAVGLAHRHILEAQEALKQGQDFGEVARKFDRGPMVGSSGVWPLMDKGSFRAAEVEQAALKMEVGQVSDVVDSVLGFYIVKTLAIKHGSKESFEKAQPKIESELRRQQYKVLTDEYIKAVQKKTVISGAEGLEKLAVDAAVRMFWNKPK